jgi:hypothetical protein
MGDAYSSQAQNKVGSKQGSEQQQYNLLGVVGQAKAWASC